MAVPKQRTSRARHRKRHAQWKTERVTLVRCRDCGRRRQPHAVCPYCGRYHGREVTAARIEDAS